LPFVGIPKGVPYDSNFFVFAATSLPLSTFAIRFCAHFKKSDGGKANEADDFRELKELSDGIYLTQVKNENAQTKKNDPLDGLDEALFDQELSPEEMLIAEIDFLEETRKRQKRLSTANHALSKLTKKQRRRYLMYHIDGKTIREIADIERAFFTTIHESLQAAEKKIKKVLTPS